MHSFLEKIAQFRVAHPNDALAFRIALIALAIVLLSLGLRLLIRHIEKKSERKALFWHMAAASSHRPLQTLIVIMAIWSLSIFSEDFLPGKFKIEETVFMKFLKVGVLLTITWMFKRIADVGRDYIKRTRARKDGGYDDFSAIEALHLAANIVIYTIALIVFLYIIGVPPTALAGLSIAGGVGAYALTMANQILISNIFAGLVLYFDRPFGPGDWIITQGGTLEGTVKKIGLRLTVLTGFDGRPIYVPNSIFNSTPTTNASRMSNRRIKQFVGVRYSDFSRVSKVIADIHAYIAAHNGIDHSRTTIVSLVDGSTMMGSSIEGCYGSSSINLQIYAYTKITNWIGFQKLQDEIMLRVGQIILDNGAQIAFPTTTIDLPEKPLPQS